MPETTKQFDQGALYRDILETLDDPLCRFSAAGRIIYGNPAFARYCHVRFDTLVGENFFNQIPAFQVQEFQRILADFEQDQQTFVIEFPERQPDGSTARRIWKGSGIWDGDGNLVQVQVMGQLLESLTEGEMKAIRRTHQLRALHQATVALLSTLNLEDLLGQILDAATMAILNAEKGFIHLFATDTGELVMRAMLGYRENDPRIQRLRLPGDNTYFAKAVIERRPFLINHISEFEQETEQEPPEVPRSAIVAPLISQDEILGVLSLQSTRQSAFTEDDLNLLATFAATATNAIHNAQLHAEVQRQAITDTLTGIYNRRGFFELGQHELERVHRFDNSAALILLDIDLFKMVNDRFGHPIGDRILQQIVEVVQRNLRKVDIFGRYGGDEFVVLLPEIDLFTAAGVADRLRIAVFDNPAMIEDQMINVTISLGVTKITREANVLEPFIQRADVALYRAKTAGRNRVEIG